MCRRRCDYAHSDRRISAKTRKTLAMHWCYRLDITAISSGPQRRSIVAAMTCLNIAVQLVFLLSLSTDVVCCTKPPITCCAR